MTSEHLTAVEKLSHVESIVESYPETAGFQAYEYFRSNVAEHKADFIQGNSQLSLEYSQLTTDKVTAIAQPMLDALRTLMPGERNDRTESLYNAIEYRYCELFLVDLARQINAGQDVPQEVIAQYRAVNEALYGKPEAEIFNYFAHQDLLMNSQPDSQDNEASRTIKAELRGLLGDIPESGYVPFLPDRELVDRIGVMVHEKFDSLIEHIDPEQTYDVKAMQTAIQQALDKIGATALGWRAVLVPNSSALSTSAHQKRIEIGVNRVDLLGIKLQKLVIHEVGVHAYRSMNGLRAGWLSAAYGLPGYLEFEEGLAVALEAAYSGSFKVSGSQYYLIAGLAYGLDGHDPRSLRSVYEIMWRSATLNSIKDVPLSDSLITKAKSVAFTRCMRLFRGSTTNLPGLVYLKDLAYFRGQELIWKYLSGVHGPAEFNRLFTGKINNSREDQLRISDEIAQILNWP